MAVTMTDAAKLYEVWVYMQAEPLFWLTLTLGCYLLADGLYRAAGLFPLLNPFAAQRHRPIAMGIADMIGGVPSLTAIITIATGITGAALGRFVLDLVRIKNSAARGFALGLSGVVTAVIIALAFHVLGRMA